MTALTKEAAENILARAAHWSTLNPKGFREPFDKNGPVKSLTLMEKMAKIAYAGIEFKGTRSERKQFKAAARAVALERMKNNPRYPRGDRRAR